MVSNIPPVEGQSASSPEMEPENDTPEQILEKIIAAVGDTWSESEVSDVRSAFDLASYLHADDKHRKQPYIYHPVRNASRLVKEMGETDHKLVIAELLHDSVEDHAEDIACLDGSDIPEDPIELREAALGIIDRLFPSEDLEDDPSVSSMVRDLSNPVYRKGEEPSKEDRQRDYLGHVWKVAEKPKIWRAKFADWVDNGLGIVNAEEDIKPEKKLRRRDKYAKVMGIMRELYYRKNGIKEMLSPKAQEYAERMFAVGIERLVYSGVEKDRAQ